MVFDVDVTPSPTASPGSTWQWLNTDCSMYQIFTKSNTSWIVP